MIIEFPEYYTRFRCIADKCPDTCCAGWQVDVDENTAEYYLSLKSPVGREIQSRMQMDGEGNHYFPLDENNRCPFLNSRNLCSVYARLGEQSLCQTCTEYPRYFVDIGYYEQADLSLSCMEAARIFFKDTPYFNIIRSENSASGEYISIEDEELLSEVLALRNQCIHILQSADSMKAYPCRERLYDIVQLISAAAELEIQDDEETFYRELITKEPTDQILKLMRSFDSISPEWDDHVLLVEKAIRDPEFTAKRRRFFTRNEHYLNTWFMRFAIYLVYRYMIDAFLDKDLTNELRFLFRGLRIVGLLLYASVGLDRAAKTDDMIYVTHIFSREVEHDEDNVMRIKAEQI